MGINRNNYQVWITDFYDGLLSDSQQAIMHRFLDLNPDLKDEFDSYGDLVLHPDISIRLDKSSLKKELSKPDPELLEYCAIALSENDMDREQEEEFLALTEQSDKAASVVSIYSNIKLLPGDIVYPNKLKLKRIPFRFGVVKVTGRAIAIAAAAAILISIAIFLPKQNKVPDTYNTAYLLPFNNGGELSENPVLTAYKPVFLKTNSIPVERVSLPDKDVEEALAVEKPERIIIALEKSTFRNKVDITIPDEPLQLLAMSETETMGQGYLDDKFSPRQFVAMNFRKLFLKEEIEDASKIKVYEVADAGINGLNKLLGWEMQFEKEKTEEGRLSSYKFSSQLLNLNRKAKNITDDL